MTVRMRLTLMYGALFFLSGAALMAIAYALLVNAGFIFSLQSGTGTAPVTARPVVSTRGGSPPGFPPPGSRTHPSPETIAHWTGVARCMRQHGFSTFPDPTTSVPSLPYVGEVSDRDGAILAIPATIDTGSAAFSGAADTCGFMTDGVEANRQRVHVREELLIQSGIALAGMSLLSLLLGWLMAGRVLRPLEDAYQAQRQFVANASHELRAPLTRLRTLSEVALASSDANASSLRRAHERVLASEQDLERLIDALLALTRGQSGLQRRERLDLATLVSEVLVARGSETTSANLDLHVTLDAATTAGDPRLLERLIANLIDNAIGHNLPGGYVEITTGTRDRHAFLTIANTGPTIPPEEIQRLFEPFERLGGARTRHNDGHGLGLSIVQAIASAHRSEINARARPGGGLVIEVSFPPATGSSSEASLGAIGSDGPNRDSLRPRLRAR
jgi:signal transduction histidine kinase